MPTPPKQRTPEELLAFKQNWRADPCLWEAGAQAETLKRAALRGLQNNLPLSAHIDLLETRIGTLERMVSDLLFRVQQIDDPLRRE